MAKWTEDITYKFVEEYIKYPCLYNCKDPTNKNRDAREAALLQISQTMNIPGFGSKEVYAKIRNLKSTYSQEVKKIKNSEMSGAGAEGLCYIPRMKWFKLLDDALSYINRDSQSNLNQDSKQEVIDGENNSTSELNQYDEKNYSDATPELQHNNEKEQRKSPIPRKRTIRDLSYLVKKVKNVADTINIPVMQSEPEFDIFGKSVAAQLKNMPLQEAIQAQMFIQNYLSNIRLQLLGHTTSISSSPSTSYTMSFTPLPNSPYPQPPPTAPYKKSPPTSPFKQSPPSSPFT